MERSGQSLRSFYQYFAGKYELLLALFEESVRTTAEHLSEVVAAETTTRSSACAGSCVEYYRDLPRRRRRASRAEERRPGASPSSPSSCSPSTRKEAARAFVPLVTLLEELLDEAAAAGVIRPGFNHRRIAGVVLQAIMFNAFAATISGSSLRDDDGTAADELWDLVLHGIATLRASARRSATSAVVAVDRAALHHEAHAARCTPMSASGSPGTAIDVGEQARRRAGPGRRRR